MKNPFMNILKGKIVIVGIGNPLRGDDAFGPALIERLRGKRGIVCIDAGSSPENYTGKIVQENPDVLLLVDAVDLGRQPGEYEILEKDAIIKSGFTTHDMSPRMCIEYLESQTTAPIYMLGIQPHNISLGEGLSDQVEKSLEEIIKFIMEALRA